MRLIRSTKILLYTSLILRLIRLALQVLTKHKQVLPVEPTAEAQVALAQSGTKKHEE